MTLLQPDLEDVESAGQRASINVDIGGTFTDRLILFEREMGDGKGPTTAHDLSRGFMQALRRTAVSLGLTFEELLERTEIIRYSTTLAINRLIERKGPRLGLFTTEGFEDTLPAGRGGAWGDGVSISEMRNLPRMNKPAPLIPRYMTVGVKERVAAGGRVVRPLGEEALLPKVRTLADQGPL